MIRRGSTRDEDFLVLGFGWLSLLTVVACAVGINRLSGPIAWALYVPFLIVAL